MDLSGLSLETVSPTPRYLRMERRRAFVKGVLLFCGGMWLGAGLTLWIVFGGR